MVTSKNPCPFCGMKEWKLFASVCTNIGIIVDNLDDGFKHVEILDDEWFELKDASLMTIVDWDDSNFSKFWVSTVDECCHCGAFVQG